MANFEFLDEESTDDECLAQVSSMLLATYNHANNYDILPAFKEALQRTLEEVDQEIAFQEAN